MGSEMCIRDRSTSSAASGETATTPTREQKRKRADKEAAADLTSIYQSTPGKSKNKCALKQLQEERKKIQKLHIAASKRIRLEAQRQKRLLEKASKLNNEDLLEIFRQRHEKQQAEKIKTEASSSKEKQS